MTHATADHSATTTAIPALITQDWLADRLGSLDFQLVAIESGHGAGADGPLRGIPGAQSFHWKQLLWDDYRREFADAAELRRRLAAAGIDAGRHLLFYGEPVQFGFYARWAFQQAGFDRVSVLDGGLPAWRAQARPLVEVPHVAPQPGRVAIAATEGSPAQSALRIGRDEILRRLGDASLRILDARTGEEYRGERVSPPGGADHGAERGGHIPGASLFPLTALLDQDGRIRPLAELEALARAAGLDAEQETAVYCRLSHRSTLLFFVLTELLGFGKVRVYDGSWTEWGSIVGAPIAR